MRWDDVRPWVTLGLTLGVLAGVLLLHLTGALLAGLVVHQLVRYLARRWHAVGRGRAEVLAVAAIAVGVGAGLTVLVLGIMAFLGDGASLNGLSQTVTQVMGQVRGQAPPWLAVLIPAPEAFSASLTQWLGDHSTSLQTLGQYTLETLARGLVGMILGGMIALAQTRGEIEAHPVVRHIRHQATEVAQAFDRVVVAQLKISALNTLFTALFLMAALPLFGVHLPFAKALIVLTFVLGLLPVMGNLVSNTLIVMVALSVSVHAGLAALGFLIAIHKLEYFLNARIVGGEIQASAWEILLSILVMEALFGLTGVVLAPIVYAYLKAQLRPLAPTADPLCESDRVH